MARDCSKVTTNTMSLGTGNISPGFNGAARASFSCLAWIDAAAAVANDNCIIQIIINAGGVGIAANIDGATVAGQRRLRIAGRSVGSDARQVANGTTNLALNTWYQFGGIIDYAGDSIEVYLDGVLETTQAVAFANGTYTHGAPTDPCSIGCYSPGVAISVNSCFDGRLAEMALWEGDIGAEAMDALGNRLAPFKVAPSMLRHYWPLDGRDSAIEPDLVGGKNATIAGSVPVIDHPRVYR